MNLESIVKKLFLGGTLTVALAVSLMTVGSYAYTVDSNVKLECTTAAISAGTCKEGSTDAEVSSLGVSSKTTFSMTVPKVLTLSDVKVTDASGSSSTIEATVNELATGKLSAKVTSNTGYTISLSAATPALTNGTNSIAAAPAAGIATLANNTWGIQKSGQTNYTGLTNTATAFFTSGGSAPSGVATSFNIGVLVDATIPAGNYSTVVTVTAATN